MHTFIGCFCITTKIHLSLFWTGSLFALYLFSQAHSPRNISGHVCCYPRRVLTDPTLTCMPQDDHIWQWVPNLTWGHLSPPLRDIHNGLQCTCLCPGQHWPQESLESILYNLDEDIRHQLIRTNLKKSNWAQFKTYYPANLRLQCLNLACSMWILLQKDYCAADYVVFCLISWSC